MDSKQKKSVYKLTSFILSIGLLVATAGFVLLSIYVPFINTNAVILYPMLAFAGTTFVLNVLTILLNKQRLHLSRLAYLYLLLGIILASYVLPMGYWIVVGVNLFNYVTLFLYFCLIGMFAMAVINFVLKLKIAKLNSGYVVDVSAGADTPTFKDEIALKKQMAELEQKAKIKDMQQKINDMQNRLEK